MVKNIRFQLPEQLLRNAPPYSDVGLFGPESVITFPALAFIYDVPRKYSSTLYRRLQVDLTLFSRAAHKVRFTKWIPVACINLSEMPSLP